MIPIYPQLIITNNLADTIRKLLDQGAFWLEETELRDIPAYRGDRMVMVGDLRHMPTAIPKLLKVLESATCKVVAVTTRDDFDATFLSRFATATKEGYMIPNTAASSLKIEEFLSDEERDLGQLVRTGPSFLPLAMSYLTSRLPAKRKLLP
jgi:hypothetical protein